MRGSQQRYGIDFIIANACAAESATVQVQVASGTALDYELDQLVITTVLSEGSSW